MRIGIDFGTTNCTICEFDMDGSPRILGPIPSTGFWCNGEFVFGQTALDQLSSNRKDLHPIRALKLSLGDQNELNFGGTTIATEKAAAALFSQLYSLIGGRSPEEVEEVVLATPVLMKAAHRESLTASARQAGLMNCRLVYEPTAALIGAGILEQVPESGAVLIVDWGGGTLDLSVVRIGDGVFREAAVRGEAASLGGTDMDNQICLRVLNQNPELKRQLSKVHHGVIRLAAEIEQEKINFLEAFDPDDEVLIAPEWLDEIIELKREMVYDVIDGFTDRAIGEVEQMLETSDIPEERLDYIIFAGGTCRADRIRNRITDRFRGLAEISVTAPQTLTGVGCARLASQGFSLRLAANFCVRQVDNSICVLLEKGIDLDTSSYRTAEFIVTDPTCPDAYVELGVSTGSDPGDILNRVAEKFLALENFSLAAGRTPNQAMKPVLEHVSISAGISPDLTVTVYGETAIAGASHSVKVAGVPLAIHVDGASPR